MVKADRAYPIKEMIWKCICEYRDRTAFEADFGKRSITYGVLGDIIEKLVGKLYGLGSADKNVVILGHNSYEYAVTFLAAMSSRLCLIPVDPSLAVDSIIERVRFCDADFVLCDDKTCGDTIRDKCPGIKVCDLKALFEEAEKSPEPECCLSSDVIEDDHVSLMLFSSGTGGRMKLAEITQINLFTEYNVVKNYEEISGNALIIAPLFHILAIADLIGNIYMGKKVYISQGFASLLKEFEYVKPKCLRMVPATADWLFRLIMDKTAEEGRKILGGKLANIRTSGAPLEEKLVRGLLEYGINTVSDYGMTEVTGPVSVGVADGGLLKIKPDTVGRVIDGITVTIRKDKSMDHGEILVSGTPLFAGYYKDEEASEECLHDGAFRTGDLGFIDDEGYLHIVGRRKNVIILSNGENIIPEIMEKELLESSLIRDCIIFKDGNAIGAKIVACEKTENIENDIRRYIKLYNKNNPTYRQISNIYFVDKLEMTGSGKAKR